MPNQAFLLPNLIRPGALSIAFLEKQAKAWATGTAVLPKVAVAPFNAHFYSELSPPGFMSSHRAKFEARSAA